MMFIFISVGSCQQEIKTYAVFSHTRLEDNSGINKSVSGVHPSSFDVLLLGGDLANLSSYNDTILSYLDSIFDVSNSKTLWALGNHDYTNVKLLKTYTKKETYYSYSQDNTLFIVLDTQLDSSRISGNQLQFFKSVTDTMTCYKNLIILTHKLIWMRGHSDLENQIDSISNGHLGECSYCIQSNNFYTDLYPTLLRLENGHVNVFCVGGDLGFKVNKFEYKTQGGIVFLATGMSSDSNTNNYIKFLNDLSNEEITYSFITL